MSVKMDTQAADIADVTPTGVQVGLVAVKSFSDRPRPRWPISGILHLPLPVAGLFLRLIVAEDMEAVGGERIIGRAERCFLARGRRNELAEPDAPLRRLSVAEGETRRERRPIRGLAQLQANAGVPGIELPVADDARHTGSSYRYPTKM